MESLIVVFHIVVAIGIIGLVLIQQGKGADAGASFGGGASQTVFGSAGSGNFLTRSTAVLATVFFVTSFSLAYFAKEKATSLSTEGLPSIEAAKTVEQEAPVVEEYAPAESEAPVID